MYRQARSLASKASSARYAPSRSHIACFSSSTTRPAALPQKPPPVPTAQKADADLWKAYAAALQQQFVKNINPQTEAFFAAPISKLGIPTGQGMAKELTNKGIFDCANPMPSLASPVYGSSTAGYYERVQGYMSAVVLNRNPDKGAKLRLNEAKAKADKLQDAKTAMEEKASAAFEADANKGTLTFDQWVSRKYPNFMSLTRELQGANSSVKSLTNQVEGPGAAELNRIKDTIYEANERRVKYPGSNMPVIDSQADALEPGEVDQSEVYYRPSYTIDGGYKDAVDQWIDQAGDPNFAGVKVTFNLAQAQKSDWKDMGFTNFSQTTHVGYTPFFRVSYTVNGQTREETISAEEASSSLSAELTAVGIQTFGVQPGSWDVADMRTQYPNLETLSGSSWPAACRVTDVVMGYKVGMNINVSADVKKKMHEMASRAVSAGGRMGVLGFMFNLGTSAGGSTSSTQVMDSMFKESQGTSVSIPGVDSLYPVLLGVKGVKLDAITPAKRK